MKGGAGAFPEKCTLKKLSLIRVKNTFMEMFIKRFSRKFFFCNENKTKAFLENCEHIFLDVEKTLENEISDKPQVI